MLEIRNLYKSFQVSGGSRSVIRDLSFTVEAGEFYIILGQSGSGKSTLLRMAGGFDKPDSGEIRLDGNTVGSPSKEMMMVFQSFDQLFPWYTLRGNLVYAMKKAKFKPSALPFRERADAYLKMAGLSGFEDSYPHQLSGGMKQRGALARALCLNPRILLMDEPFSSLDYITRKNAHQNIREMKERTGCTVILVTHNIEEALTLGTSVAVLSGETGRFKEVVRREKNGFEPGLRDRLREYLA